ncbi:MAG: alanine:cation symporter family protein [Lachnospiraceae bacterium]|nr:alanine:cation symporter family protein [Lachnospiraceae bacterium]
MAEFFNTVIDKVTQINSVLNNFIWGPIMLVFFLLVGLMFTVRTKVFQISHIKYWLDVTILQLFRKERKGVLKTEDKHSISQFQSLCTALAATIGVGNISGVAVALALGGPGAIFWMWLSAFLGMMTNYAENTLGIKYRYKNEKGHWIGGAMIYIEKGLGWKWLAVIFSVFCILASFGIGNMSQGNEIANGLKSSFGVPTYITAIIIMIFAGLVILGGIKRIASVTEKIVPFMALTYILGALIVIFSNVTAIPSAFASIFTNAFNLRSAGGGAAGFTIMIAMRRGISRGVFSNEAGLGSSVMVHSASDVKEPVVQGMWGIFEVFADTLIVCTMTALTILTSGVYDYKEYAQYVGTDLPEHLKSGVALTSAAFESVFGGFGSKFISIAIMLFAFSTILGWSYYGERAIEYLFGLKAVPVYKIIFILIIFIGCNIKLSLVVDISDTFNGFMALPNLIAVTLLSGQVVQMTKDYIARVKSGKETIEGDEITK